jgi:hypothetical protein
MKGIALVLFLLVFSIIMTSLVTPAYELFGFSESIGISFLLTFLFSLLGIGLAIVYFWIKQLSSSVQRYLKIGIFTVYPVILVSTYLLFGLSAFFALCLVLLKIIFILLISVLPMMFTYGFLRRIKTALIAPSVGIIFLFFFTFLLPNSENRIIITPDEPWFFILLFIGYVSFFELATASLFYTIALEKMTMQETMNEFVVERLSKVVNSYIIHLVLAMVICAVFTGGVILLKDVFVSSSPTRFLGVDLGSVSGIFLFAVITIVSVLLFWLFSPMKKTKNQIRVVTEKEIE